jgi:hypothetical protein
MTKDEALKLALEKKNSACAYWTENEIPIIEKLRELLADPMREVQRLGQEIEQEPTAKYSDIVSDGGLDPRNKFDVSPQRTWVGLTDKVITKVVDSMPRGINGWMSDWDLYVYARAIEAKLKEKNT